MPGASRATVGGEETLGEVVTAAIADGVGRLLGNERALRADDGDRAETVHQMRVATRRLRSDLRTFRDALDRDWASALRGELGWLAGLLGTARDADVLWQLVADRAQELAPERAEGAARVIAALADQRAEAHTELSEALAGDRYRLLAGRLRSAAASPALQSPGGADRAASKALPAVVRRPWRRLERQVDSLGSRPADDELHKVRIFAKRCRYAAEACAPALGKPAERVAGACKKLQTVLGDLNDAVVAERWLRGWATRPESVEGAQAAEDLAALERASARKARRRWPKAWERALADAAAAGWRSNR